MAESFDKRHLAESLRDTQQPLERSRTLPAPCYDAEAIHALEQERLFARHWLAIACEEDFPGAGHFVTRVIGRERILVVRGHDACLRAFFNVCRHRGVPSRGYRPGPYAASERCVHAFDGWYARWLASALASA